MNRSDVIAAAARRPVTWRYGQAIWNYAEDLLGPDVRARYAGTAVDCYHRDDLTQAFLDRLEADGLLETPAVAR